MVGIMAESSSYVVREFHEKCFNRTQFILRTVMAPNKILRSFSVTSPTHDVIKAMLTSHVLHFAKSVFIFRVLSHIVGYISRDNPKVCICDTKFPTPLVISPPG